MRLLLSAVAVVALVGAGCSKGTLTEEGAPGSTAREREVTVKPSLVLPEGTPIQVRLVSTLSTATQMAGETFEATLAEPLIVGARTIAARGTSVTGKVVQSDPGGRVKGVASIAVQLTGLRTDAGQQIEISTGSVAREARATKSKDAQKIGIGAGIGAVVGAIAGGGKGAAIGAAAGGGAGTGVVLATKGKSAVLPSETVLNFKLLYPVTVND